MNNLTSNEELPYERFMRSGAESLSDTELIAVILRTGTRNRSAVELARAILTENGRHAPELEVLFRTNCRDLTAIPGIGEVKAVKLLSIAELSKRLARTTSRHTLLFDQPDTVYRYYAETLRHEPREVLLLLCLDTKLTLIREIYLSTGTIDHTIADPREIIKEALRENASAILIVHNHPSGDPTPSGEDIRMTQTIKKAVRSVGLSLIDHIIIGDDYRSMRMLGYLDEDDAGVNGI